MSCAVGGEVPDEGSEAVGALDLDEPPLARELRRRVGNEVGQLRPAQGSQLPVLEHVDGRPLGVAGEVAQPAADPGGRRRGGQGGRHPSRVEVRVA